ncbi:MAG: imidazolonepropionase [Gemmatimonadaceae bacterium]|nr:imidazolonepropionase [Gemmatimonadaceae bacterium]
MTPPDARLFVHCAQVVTCAGPGQARRGPQPAEALGLVADGAVLVAEGRIAAVGPRAVLERAHPDVEPVDCRGGVLLPGFCDSHTHALFGRPRHAEQELRAAGTDYMAIAAQGGGIHSSVRDLRARDEDGLVALGRDRLRRLAMHGVTTVEVKSGYGLSLDDELKSLRAIRRLAAVAPLRVIPTFLGAHEIPLEARGDAASRARWMDVLAHELLPAVAAGGLAHFADVFCEPGVYTVPEARRLLREAAGLGLGLKLHADELSPSGGAELAAELGAISADHLGAISEAGIRALAQAGTVATLLPHTLLFLGKTKQAPARALLEAGAAVAVATDFNPGTSPTPNFPLVLTLAVSQLRLSVAEAVVAATVNGAAALGLAHEAGQVAPGFRADLALFEVEDVREIPYWSGDHRCLGTWVAGRPAWQAPGIA